MTTPTPSEDMIDSRDVIERIDELEADDDLDENEREELAALKALADEAEGYADDWQYGETLIRGTYFTEYAKELADDIGAIAGTEQWPLMHIDWEAAADDLKHDYTEVEFDGVPYFIR